jgi:tRNA (cmo5U34)-methyltransferase
MTADLKNNSGEAASRFDREAAQWDSNPGRVALARAVAAAIRGAVPLHAGMAAMDFGAGTGLLTLALLPFVSTMTAVDASAEMLRVMEQKLAAAKLAGVQTLHGDIAHQALPAAAFDLIVSSMAMHHIRDVPAVLAKLRPCLRAGGWIALADLDTEDGSFHPDPTGVYHTGFDRGTMTGWLTRAGFADARVTDAYRMDRAGRQYGIFLAVGRGQEHPRRPC